MSIDEPLEWVEDALRALNKRLEGGELTDLELTTLGTLESQLGLKRAGGLASYAPRTRRRYIAAARRGHSATEANRRDYRRRPSIDERINSLAEKLQQFDYPPGLYNQDSIDTLKHSQGKRKAEKILRQQLDSTEKYKEGDPLPGRGQWASLLDHDAPDEETEFMRMYLKKYHWYHGRR